MKQIILCADDYGQNPAVSQAIIELLANQRLSAVSCLTTATAWQQHQSWLSPFIDQVDIGLHFNLTEGKPLTQALHRSHGFLPLSQLIVRAFARQVDKDAIEAELHAQLDAFEKALGRLPDFIDGHQHIQQLPVVRDVLLSVYQTRLQAHGPYLRSVHHPFTWLKLSQPAYLKRLILGLVGARTFKQQLAQQAIPHNTSFAGVYAFEKASNDHAKMFRHFLANIQDGGIIMCHPGFESTDETDAIAAARPLEFRYFMSEQFVQDCDLFQVRLARQNHSK